MRTCFVLIAALVAGAVARADFDCERLLVIERPFVYRLTRDRKTSHVFGTRHVGVSLSDMPSAVIRMLHRADDLTVEVKPRARTSRVIAQNRADAHRGDDLPLSERLTAAQFAALIDRLRENGIPTELADTLSPLGACLLISPTMRNLPAAMARGELDREIQSQFVYRPIYGLETAAKQRRDRLTAVDLDHLRMHLDRVNLEDADAALRRYCAGDEGASTEAVLRMTAEAPRYHRIMNSARNARWEPLIEERHETRGRHVVAVGATHLFGPEGLLARLRARGFKVRRVPWSLSGRESESAGRSR